MPMTIQTRAEPEWPAFPGIPLNLLPPSRDSYRGGPTFPAIPPSTSSRLNQGFTAGQLYAAISSSKLPSSNREQSSRSKTLRVPTQITITNDEGVQQGHRVGLGIEQLIQETRTELSSSRISRVSSSASHALHKAVDDEEARDWASRLEKKIWQYNRSNSMGKRWLMEILSWITSAICMSAIIIVLIIFDGKALSSWRFLIGPNTYISVLSKVSTSALLFPVAESLGQLKWSWFRSGSKRLWDFEIFDNASRGPWGSCMLLLRAKRSLAALGAIITITSLALDPFFQQVFTFEERLVLLSMNSTIPKAAFIISDVANTRLNGLPLILPSEAQDNVAQKFFFGNGTQPIPAGAGFRPDVPLSCATEHCSWGEYETLGVCGTCKDMPSKILNWTCLFGSVDWSETSNDPSYIKFAKGNIPPNRNRTSCGWFLNSTTLNPIMMNGFAQSLNSSLPEETLITRILPLYDLKTKIPFYNGVSPAFSDVRYPISDFFFVTSAEGTVASTMSATYPIAQECAVYWCVKRISSTYSNGNYVEKTLSEYHDTLEKTFPWSAPFENSYPSYLQNITMAPPNSDTLYGVTNTTFLETLLIMEEMVPSFHTTTTFNTSAAKIRWSLGFNKAARITTLRPTDFDPWIGRNITEHIERLAYAFTQTIRSEDDGVSLILGETSGQQTQIVVKWAWFALPAAILFSSLAFLLATMVKSSREQKDVGIWKTSAMATLLNGLPGSVQERLNTASHEVSPFLKAQDLRVGLRSNRHGWRLSNTLSPIGMHPGDIPLG